MYFFLLSFYYCLKIFGLGVMQVITLDLSMLVAGTKYRGEFEGRIKKLTEEVKQNDDIILFIDEVHTLIGAGAAEGSIDAANILKPALARGELQVILFHNMLPYSPSETVVILESYISFLPISSARRFGLW